MNPRTAVARAFFRRPRIRRAVARFRDVPDVSHLAILDETVWGPIQRDEALLLFGLLRTIRPQTVVEFDFLYGRSALNFLLALDADARLYSFDITDQAASLAADRFAHDRRFTYRAKSQADFEPADVDGRPVDFVFLDAVHDLELNIETFRRLEPVLSGDAIVAVHDTGTVPRRLMPEGHWLLDTSENWVGDEYEGQPGERAFVNWVFEQGGYAQLHAHSRRTVRCGLTLIQRAEPLARP